MSGLRFEDEVLAKSPSGGKREKVDKQPYSSVQDLLEVLTKQKESIKRPDPKGVALARQRLKQSQSEPGLAADPILASSTMPGSAKFSFGKPRHCKGRFKIQTLNPRDSDFSLGTWTPGVGSYDVGQPDGKPHQEMHGGATGGWHMDQHEVFRKTFEEYGRKASPEFFDKVAFRLPGVKRPDLTDHARWLAEYEKKYNKKFLRAARWREEFSESISEELAKSRRQQEIADKRSSRELLEHSQMEEARETGGQKRPPVALFQAHQKFGDEVLDGNLRGHPQYRKSPGYTFGTSNQIRDHTTKKLTHQSAVRSSSHLDNPGPGQYLGQHEFNRTLPEMASYSFRKQLPTQKVDQTTPWSGPGYAGHKDASFAIQDDLRMTQNRQPAYPIGKEHARLMCNSNEMHSIRDKWSTPDNLGPGSYTHATAFLSQY